jgi:phosphatidylglycerophosphate synthase
VHPNAITITGMLLNFCIFYAITHEMLGETILMLSARYFADCLDGGVARKYDKKSKMGGALDSGSDTILIYVSTFGIFHLYKLPYGSASAVLVSCLNLFMMSLSGSLVDHAGMKVGGSCLEILYAFLVNNSYTLFIVKIVMVYVAIEVDPVW